MLRRSLFNKKLAIALIGIVLLVISIIGALVVFNKNSANAVSAIDFNAGNIISNNIFYDANSMSVNDIQAFLDRLTPNCDVWGTQRSGVGSLTNAQYAASIGWPGPPYVCLNKYYENPQTLETSYERGGGAFAGGISAAQIIYNAAQQYGINPRVLLVMLKKESLGPLTADTWPLKSQYRYAMGYACPDSGPNNSANCNATQAGFYNQMMKAAWQLNYYREHPNDYRYRLGWNDIQYSPDPTCGTKRVYIENIATLSLYIYTPYTPNNGSLANYPGTAHCGSYGNRNFFMFYNEWFGSTQYDGWLSMGSRYLKLNKDTRMINAETGEVDTAVKPKGLIPYFTAKTILRDGRQCLRPQGHTIMCILWSDLSETAQWQSIQSRYLAITPASTTSVDVDTLQPQSDTYIKNQHLYFTSKAVLPNGDQCLRTEVNTNTASGSCILWSHLREQWLPMGDRYLKLNKDTRMINADNGAIDSTIKPKGIVPFFNAQAILPNGKQCLRPIGHTNMCILFEDLDETAQWESMGNRHLAIAVPSTTPVNADTLQPAGSALTQNQVFYFTSKTILPNGDQCLRTEANTDTASGSCILWSHLREQWLPMGDRYLKLNKDTRMINANNGAVDSAIKPKGLTPFFNAKTFLTDGRQCLRPVGHTSMCILWEDLSEV